MTSKEAREVAQNMAAEFVTDAFWRFGKKPSHNARVLCLKWTEIIAAALEDAASKGAGDSGANSE